MEHRNRIYNEEDLQDKDVFNVWGCEIVVFHNGSPRAIHRCHCMQGRALLQCIMHNCLNVLKQVVSITAYKLKSAICKGIRDFLHVGSDLIRNRSIVEFYNRMKCYNEDKELELRQHLGLV
jgi:hypothetical protein